MASANKSGREGTLVLAYLTCALLATACEQSATPGQSTGQSPAVASIDNAGELHAYGKHLDPKRPECPQVWGDSFPLWVAPAQTPSTLGRAGGPGTASIVWVGHEAADSPGPITDIPEFHDCQKFIREDGASYDSLYAVFAAFKLDSIIDSLHIDTLAWTTSSAPVASVTPAGVVTGVAPGNVTITGASTVDPARTMAFNLTVVPGPAADTTVYVGPGLPLPPNIKVGQKVAFMMTLAPPTKSTFPVGEVYTYGGGYGDLGIGANFSCFFIYFDANGVLSARMVKVSDLGITIGPGVHACDKTFDLAPAIGTPLQIVRHIMPKSSDIPPAVRWDWDKVNKKQYIGIKCGSAWCELGKKGFVSSGHYTAAASELTQNKKVVQNKGWYDEQILAMLDKSGKDVVPSGIVGTVIPEPEDKSRTVESYHNHFLPIAYVALDARNAKAGALAQYTRKFHFVGAPMTPQTVLSDLNRIELCLGTAVNCKVDPLPPADATCAKETLNAYETGARWWVRLTPASSASGRGRGNQPLERPKPMYRCTTRRLHTDLPEELLPPKTSRWRWLALDETVWRECAAGCCEVEVNPPTGPGWPP